MPTLSTLPRWFHFVAGLACWLVLVPPSTTSTLRADDIQVTVVAVLATDRNSVVDPEVKCIADEVKKLEPSLTGYRLARTTCKALAVGQKDTYPLVDDETVTVTLHQASGKDKKVSLTIKPPLVGEITYMTICGKFFPIVTRYQTKDKDRLIIAVMVKPCNGEKRKEKDKRN